METTNYQTVTCYRHPASHYILVGLIIGFLFGMLLGKSIRDQSNRTKGPASPIHIQPRRKFPL